MVREEMKYAANQTGNLKQRGWSESLVTAATNLSGKSAQQL
jgi:hypothetical protein